MHDALRRAFRPARTAAALWVSAAHLAACVVVPIPLRRQQAPVDQAPVRVTTFGDSNTDMAWSPEEPHVRARSYVSTGEPRPAPSDPNAPETLAGLVEARWRAASARPIRVVNHGISGTTTGGGGHGGADRNGDGAPNARTEVGGVTRFEGEVLGAAYPWSGGEPRGRAYPAGAIARVNAYTPVPGDFAYVSLGTNDMADGHAGADATAANLAWMVGRWTAAGHRADHLVLTTLAPRPERPEVIAAVLASNDSIRAIARRTGAGLIELSGYTSADGGRTWRAPSMHVGDRLHYTTPVRAWIADQLVAYMRAHG